MTRALQDDEIAYLKTLKAPLDEALLAACVTLLAALVPLATASAAWHGVGGDRLALALGAVVLALLLAGLVVYSGLGARARACTWSALKRRRALGEDLAAGEAELVTATVEDKPVSAPDAQGQRRYEVVADGRRYAVSGARWLEIAPGQRLELAVSPNAQVVLAIDGQRDRLASKRRAAEPEPAEG